MLQGHVEIIRNFASEALQATDRCFRVYLPPHYEEENDRAYPVVYMHDGQWVFGCEEGKECDRQVPTEYQLDRIVDELIKRGEISPVILVGVDCDEANRRKEMSHSTPVKARRMGRRGYIPCNSFDGEGLGFAYQQFITDEVKPYVDLHYRTLPQREHTMITGSSMGGLVSLRMGVYRSDLFGLVGLQSPAIHWETDEFYNGMKNDEQKIWLDCGGAEAYYVDNARSLVKLFNGLGYHYGQDYVFYMQPGARHSGEYFGPRFEQMMKWFFGRPAKPVSAQILARDNASVSGHVTILNTLVTYDNGIVLSDMDANYQDTAGLTSIEKTGEVHPHSTGETVIRYEKDGLIAEKPMTIVNSLSEDILLNVRVTIPEDTPKDGPIVYHFFRDQYFILDKKSDTVYEGFIGVPRDWCFDGHFTRCAENRDKKTENTPYRRVECLESQWLEYHVDGWKE